MWAQAKPITYLSTPCPPLSFTPANSGGFLLIWFLELGTVMKMYVSLPCIPLSYPTLSEALTLLKIRQWLPGPKSTFPDVSTDACAGWQRQEVQGNEVLSVFKGKMRPSSTFCSLFSSKRQRIFGFALSAALSLQIAIVFFYERRHELSSWTKCIEMPVCFFQGEDW